MNDVVFNYSGIGAITNKDTVGAIFVDGIVFHPGAVCRGTTDINSIHLIFVRDIIEEARIRCPVVGAQTGEIPEC